ncbi:hypothetical protein MKW98_006452 [Papaver atlanticum]|uniref:RING-type domain-containing protein n=1 Tax=Papaver atlanticum TaxID=357466 RepID=A0AAD4XF88_9MAGN|nr:hypothetical protein MKW98_006452 [Papaver atlanticum]
MEIASVEENNVSTQTPDSFVSSMPSVAIVEMCSVCMVGPADQNESIIVNGDEKEEEELGKQMPCKHIYHAHCITTWLSRHNTCPLCRSQMITTTTVLS